MLGHSLANIGESPPFANLNAFDLTTKTHLREQMVNCSRIYHLFVQLRIPIKQAENRHPFQLKPAMQAGVASAEAIKITKKLSPLIEQSVENRIPII